MPLIPQVGRKSKTTIILISFFYLILVLGSITMIYPFALMIASSICSNADYHEFRLFPRYLFNEKMLFKKYIVDKGRIVQLGYEYGEQWYHPIDIKIDFKTIDPEKSVIDQAKTKEEGYTVFTKKVMKTIDDLNIYFEKDTKIVEKIYSDWLEFLKICPDIYKFAYFTDVLITGYSVIDERPEYRRWLQKKYHDNIEELNKTYLENAEKFTDISTPYEDPLRQRWILPLDKKYQDWMEFKSTLPPGKIRVITAELAFQKFLIETYPMLEELKKITGLDIKKHSELTLHKTLKEKLLPPEIISAFIKHRCPVIFLKLDASLATDFYDFINQKYKDYPEKIKKEKLSVKFSEMCPMDTEYSGQANEWIEFMEKVPIEKIKFCDPTLLYHDFLLKKYGSIENINKEYGFNLKDITELKTPVPWIDIHTFRERKTELFWSYLLGNYIMVLKVLFVHGRAFMNTVIFIILCIACSLTFNPLAAYALSRYKLSYTNKILLFLLATMAFPHSVGMIPSFLLLKDLGLLNTFAALVLPGLANGYSIFLLKGFFDSLPSELYEAALIDGASELTIFYKMAIPMTKPILAIIALNAFSHAYSAFMFAFLTCQDPKMWTLMVFLYEFQQTYPNYLVMASLVIAAIPTLTVFVFCQNIILRGIVIPSFK